jgi:hypothetical protein
MTRKATKSSDSIGSQILDTAFNVFVRRIVWAETSKVTMTRNDRDQMANVMTSILEMTSETLIAGAIPDEIRAILQRTANEIDLIGRNININKPENLTEKAEYKLKVSREIRNNRRTGGH